MIRVADGMPLVGFRTADGLKVVRKHIRGGEARTAVWRRNGHPVTLQTYRNGIPDSEPRPERRQVERWAESEARLLLSEPVEVTR